MDPRKILSGNGEYEFVPAEVVSVDYNTVDRLRVYSVLCKILNSSPSSAPTTVIQARPLYANIKQIPINGEIVLVCKAPSRYFSIAGNTLEYYYTFPVSVLSSVHHNGLPGANSVSFYPKTQEQQTREASLGITPSRQQKNENPIKIDPSFPERLDVFPLQPFSGDLILEGRWGQSIRFGSSVDTRRKYQIDPTWEVGQGSTGNPITIISNGTNPNKNEKQNNDFHMENPDVDDSSIWLTSGQAVNFTPASTYTPSIFDKQIGLFKKNKFAGNQVIISSDRLIFNARNQEIVGFAKEGIGFSSEKVIGLNGKNLVEIESNKISLGFNATSPIILGDRLIDLLDSLMRTIVQMNKSIQMMTHPTGVGPSGTPINSGDYASYVIDLNKLISNLPKIASKFAFVNEKAGGPSDADKSRHEQIKDNNFVTKPVTPKKGGSEQNTVNRETATKTNDFIAAADDSPIAPTNVPPGTLVPGSPRDNSLKRKVLKGKYGSIYTSNNSKNSPFIMVYGGIRLSNGREPDTYMMDYFTTAKTGEYNIYNRKNVSSTDAVNAYNEATELIKQTGITPSSYVLYCFSGGNGNGCAKILRQTSNVWNKIYIVGPWLGGGPGGQELLDVYLPEIEKDPSKFLLSTVGGWNDGGDAGKSKQSLSQKRELINAFKPNRVIVGKNHMEQNDVVITKLVAENPVDFVRI